MRKGKENRKNEDSRKESLKGSHGKIWILKTEGGLRKRKKGETEKVNKKGIREKKGKHL